MQALLDRLKEDGIRIVFLELDKPGYYSPNVKIMFVNQKQSEEQIKRVIYHELKHAMDHADYVSIYKEPVPLIKMESEANDYMIDKIIEENGGVYNYTQLIEGFNIRMGKDIKYCN